MSPAALLRWSSVFLVLSLSGLTAAEDRLSLERQTPVPATEPIPIKDFFRPGLMHSPEINAAGTHIAAIVGGRDDHQQLLVYSLRTQKGEVLGGRGDKDIYTAISAG